MSKPDGASTPDPVEEDPVGGVISAGRWGFIFLLSVVVNGADVIQGDGNWWDIVAALLSVALFAYSVRQVHPCPTHGEESTARSSLLVSY